MFPVTVVEFGLLEEIFFAISTLAAFEYDLICLQTLVVLDDIDLVCWFGIKLTRRISNCCHGGVCICLQLVGEGTLVVG